KPTLLIAVEAAAVACPVPKLVERGAIPIYRLMESRLRRHLHKVVARTVEGLGAADVEPRATRRDQRIGSGDCVTRIGAGHGHGESLRESLALFDVENDKALEERHLPRLAVLALRLLILGLRGEAVGIANHRAFLAAPDISACGLGLPVGQPLLRRIAL